MNGNVTGRRADAYVTADLDCSRGLLESKLRIAEDLSRRARSSHSIHH